MGLAGPVCLAGGERGVGFPKRELPGTSTICLVLGDSLGLDTGGDMADFLVLTTDSFLIGQAIYISVTHRRVELHVPTTLCTQRCRVVR